MIAGVIVMAFVAITFGYFFGNFVLGFITTSAIDPTSTAPTQNEILLTAESEKEEKENEDGLKSTTISIPESNYTPDTQYGGLYIVQFGAFNSKANAERLKNELLDKNFHAIVTEGPPYKVQLCSQTREEAENLKKQVKDDGYIDVFIVH